MAVLQNQYLVTITRSIGGPGYSSPGFESSRKDSWIVCLGWSMDPCVDPLWLASCTFKVDVTLALYRTA